MHFASKILAFAFIAAPITSFAQNTQDNRSTLNAVPATTPAVSATVPLAPVTIAKVARVYLQSSSKGNNRNSNRDQSSEMAKDFEKDCPDIRITINQAKADYTITLSHIEIGAFIRDNQFEVYDADGDRMKGKEGGSIRNGVKGVCTLITKDWTTKNSVVSPGQ